MAKDDSKSFKMDTNLKNIVNERIEKSGMEGAEWLESLMALEVIHRIKDDEPAIEQDLKDLEKFMNRIYHILIRVYQRGSDAIEELKENSLEEASRVAEELEHLRFELSMAHKNLNQKEEELGASYTKNSELRQKLEQSEKTSKTIEELNRLTNEKVEQLQIRIEELLNAERAAEELKEQVVELRQSHAQEISLKKEEEANLLQQLTDLQKESDRQQKDADEIIARLQNDHEREKEILKKDMEMKAREEILNLKSECQEKINQISEQHATKVAILVDKLQGNMNSNN